MSDEVFVEQVAVAIAEKIAIASKLFADVERAVAQLAFSFDGEGDEEQYEMIDQIVEACEAWKYDVVGV